MSELLRKDTIFGKRANIVGDISADLVLESLGKIYIKSRNSSKTLEEVIKSIALTDIDDLAAGTLIVEGIENIDYDNLKEGQLVYDKLSNILYLYIDGHLIELINVAPEGTGYVKRSGDTMTGRLTINVPNGPPLYVNSTVMVPNLNANYLQGETADAFTRRQRNELITGSWTFRAPTKFESNVRFGQDIIVGGSVGTPEFASGFGGYGWRMDADSNTLTVDNLVVRKLMQVYELVVNKISATNGSLWVTNAGKVKKCLKLPIFTTDDFRSSTLNTDLLDLLRATDNNGYFIIFPSESGNMLTLSGEALLNASGNNRNSASLTTYTTAARKEAYVVNITNSSIISQFISNGGDKEHHTLTTGIHYKDGLPVLDAQEEAMAKGYETFYLYADDFNFDVIFPIIPRDYYQSFRVSEYYRKLYEKDYIKDYNTDYSEYVALARRLSSVWPGSYYDFLDASSIIANVKSYYKYFASGDFYMVRFEEDELPVFKAGDILRCLKWTYGGIKYYDAVVCNYIDSNTCIIQLAPSIMDYTTRISYDESLNPTVTEWQDVQNDTLNTTTNRRSIQDTILGMVEEKDALVLMGNLWDSQRLNAVYITSTDDGAPFIDVLSGLNRPDYSVIYYQPVYKIVKLHKKDKTTIPGHTNYDIPYTGDYYVLEDSDLAQYAIGDLYYNGTTFKGLFYDLSQGNIDRLASNILYLSTTPNSNTELDMAETYGNILTEDEEYLSTENNIPFVLEAVDYGFRSNSTKTTKVRIGKLDGILDELFPIDKLPYGYGLYASNVFLVGEFYLSNGRSLAEISEEAITFATAARDASLNEMAILRRDTALVEARLDRAILRLKNNVYTRNTLLSAGIKIKDNVLGIWGGSILMFTTYDELYGWTHPTALFENGKILGKFLGVDEAHSNISASISQTQFTYNNTTYVSNDPYIGDSRLRGTVRVLRPKTLVSGSDYYVPGSVTYYIRRFYDGTNYVWIKVNPDGYPPKDSYGDYKFETVSFYINELNSTANTGSLTSDEEEYLIYSYSEPLRMWGFEIDGKSNIGGSTLYINPDGKVVVNGILYSDEGKIGGFMLSNDKLYLKQEGLDYSSIVLATSGYKWKASDQGILPYIQLNTLDNQGEVESSATITSKGIYYQGGGLIMLTPGIVFQLMLIPVSFLGTDIFTLYARLTGKGCFSTAKVAYEEGYFDINFPYLGETGIDIFDEQSDWFVRSMLRGDIYFYTTGTNYAWTDLSSDTSSNWYFFNADKLVSNGRTTHFLMWNLDTDRIDKIKGSIGLLAFKSRNYNFNFSSSDIADANFGDRLAFRADLGRPYVPGTLQQQSLAGGVTNIGLRDSNNFSSSWGKNWNNVITLSTSDDASVNWGGIILCCMYTPGDDGREVSIDGSVDLDGLEELLEKQELRLQIIELYGASGTRYTELLQLRNSVLDGLTISEELEYSEEISNIESSISLIYEEAAEVANTLNSFTLLELQNKKDYCDGLYDSAKQDLEYISEGESTQVEDASCTCSVSGEFNSLSRAYSSDGTSSSTKVGEVQGDCTIQLKYVAKESGGSWVELSSGDYDPLYSISISNGEITAKIHENKSTDAVKRRYYLNCKTSQDEYDFFTFWQEGAENNNNLEGTDEDLDALLSTFNKSSLFNSKIESNTDLYSFLSSSLLTANTKKSSYNISTITNGPIAVLSSGYDDDAFLGFFMGMLLTALFPYTGTSSINNNSSSRRNSDVLAAAHQTWGASLSDSVSTYVKKYKGELLASVVFSVMMSDSTFRTLFVNIKDSNPLSGYTTWYNYCDKDLFSLTSIAPDGKEIFDKPLSNSYVNSTLNSLASNLEERDEIYYRNGKNSRKADGTYDSTDGGIANNDASHVNNHPNLTHDRIGYFVDIYTTATSNKISISTPSSSSISHSYFDESDSRNWQDADSNGDHPGLTGLSYSYKTYAKYCLLDMAYKPGRNTVNNIKTSSTSSDWFRYRPFKAHSDDAPMTYENGDDDTGNLNNTSYPSGHSGYGWGMALAYSTLSSSFTSTNINNLFARAYRYGQSRVIVGAHWQSDVEVGRLAAACSFAQMCGNKLFINQINLAQ